MKHNSSPFKWRHYPPESILLCVRWYCRFQLSCRDVEEMMRERGLDVDHSTVFGAVNIVVYVMGRVSSSNWLGVSTRIVET
jgi:transposase-like protein